MNLFCSPCSRHDWSSCAPGRWLPAGTSRVEANPGRECRRCTAGTAEAGRTPVRGPYSCAGAPPVSTLAGGPRVVRGVRSGSPPAIAAARRRTRPRLSQCCQAIVHLGADRDERFQLGRGDVVDADVADVADVAHVLRGCGLDQIAAASGDSDDRAALVGAASSPVR